MSLPSNPLGMSEPELQPYMRWPYAKFTDEHRQSVCQRDAYLGLKRRTYGIEHSSKFPFLVERTPWREQAGANAKPLQPKYASRIEPFKAKSRSPWHPPRGRA